MNITDKYTELVRECEQLDYSDREALLDYVDNKFSKYSLELALVVMINIQIKEFEETEGYVDPSITDHIQLAVYYDGNETTYRYIQERYKDYKHNPNVEYCLGKLLKILEDKYKEMGINLIQIYPIDRES